MIEHKEHFHGSDLEVIERIYGIRKEDITSFSANVNPLGISPLLRKNLADNIDRITSYPDREYTALRKSIAAYTGSSFEHIAVGNGSTELISIVMQITKPGHALLFTPSYSEYEHEITLAGGSYEYFYLKEENDWAPDLVQLDEKLNNDIDLLVICNPNNPTSYALNTSVMRHILEKCVRHNILVMVDETYAEFAPNEYDISSLSLTAQFKNIIVLRGISKFFAAPGLRLGYAVCSDTVLLGNINAKKNPWTINSLAEAAGQIMFSDTDYINATKKLINTERERMFSLISRLPVLKPYKSFSNFMLVKILTDNVTASDIFDAAIRRGLMIRDCSTFESLDEHFFRFCFMKPEKNDELYEVIKCTVMTQE